MSDTMNAIVCYAPLDYRLEEVAMPKAGPGEVVIKVNACGVCASDIKCYLNNYTKMDAFPLKVPLIRGI